MLEDHSLINCYLILHPLLQTLSTLKYHLKDKLTSIANLLIQHKTLSSIHNPPHPQFQQATKYALLQLQQTLFQQIHNFESYHQQKLQQQIITKLHLLHNQLTKMYGRIQWNVFDDNYYMEVKKQNYYLALVQLYHLAGGIIDGYIRQGGYVRKQWGRVRDLVIIGDWGQDLVKRVEVLALHISYESHVEPNIIQAWGKALAALQNKRH